MDGYIYYCTSCITHLFFILDINGHFSFTNYQQIFTTKYLKMFAYSILYAALITIITLAISYPAAYYITLLEISKYLINDNDYSNMDKFIVKRHMLL